MIIDDIIQDNNKVLGDESRKLSSYIGWRRAWSKPFLHFRVWLRWINGGVDLRKITLLRK